MKAIQKSVTVHGEKRKVKFEREYQPETKVVTKEITACYDKTSTTPATVKDYYRTDKFIIDGVAHDVIVTVINTRKNNRSYASSYYAYNVSLTWNGITLPDNEKKMIELILSSN